MTETLDLRLAPAAAAAWAGAALVVLAPPGVVAATAFAAVAALLAALVAPLGLEAVATRRRARYLLPSSGARAAPFGRGCRTGRAEGVDRVAGAGGVVGPGTGRAPGTAARPAAGVAAGALALVVLLGVLAVGAAQRHARDSGPLAQAAAAGWTATVRGVVAGEPQVLPSAWSGAEPRVRYTLAAGVLEARGRTTSARGSLVVLGRGDPPAAGSTVVVTGRLRPPASRADRATATMVSDAGPRSVREPSGLRRWVAAVRAAARTVVARVPGDAGALLLGVALGDTSRVDGELSDALAVAGLTHLVAVSGAHFVIIGALVAAGAAACRLPRAARASAVLAAGAFLVLLVGPQPSVLRAAVMGAVGLAGLLAGRPSRAPAALAAAVVVLLLTDPWLAVELGFALSVVATAAIVLLGGAWTARWAPRLGRGVAAGVAVPLAAQLACGPVLLAVRPAVGAYAVVANVLVAPAVGPATVLGVGAAVLAPSWPGGALVLAHLGGAACWWVAAVGRAVAHAPGAALAWAPGWLGVAALVAASAAAAALLTRAGRARTTGPPGAGSRSG